MPATSIATMTVELRIRRLWLLQLNIALWRWLGWLVPWADPWVVTARIVRLIRAEMRVCRRCKWERLPATWELEVYGP